jgi:hypothetical protein
MEEKKMAKTCNNCGNEKQTMSTVTMSSADWQKNEQRHERREKRYIWIIVLLILLVVGSNVGWLIYESQFEVVEETSTTVTQDNENGYNNYIGNDGDINYGETNNKND